MSRPIIEIRQLSKLYHAGMVGYRTLRESLAIWWARRRNQPLQREGARFFDPIQAGPFPDTFWALHDVSINIERGEIVGIIGRNGAGKSTLLKILSRITEPTSGEALLRGRVGSLLEVGAGFHPELSGRDNVFLNGAMMGMKRRDIEKKFDEIIAFADVGPFLDTPVKRYSSGMYVRLAFAVAAHLEPNILIVDEVLSVGDVRFQKKCLGKMEEVSTTQGRTVLLVSHNLEAVQRLCSHSMLLDRGRLIEYGVTRSVLAEYLGMNLPTSRAEEWIDVSSAPREGTGEARFSQVRFSSGNPACAGQPYSDGPIEFTLSIDAATPVSVESIAVDFWDENGRKLVTADLGLFGQKIQLAEGRTTVRLKIEQIHLKPGNYILSLWMARYASGQISSGDLLDFVEKALEIEVNDIVPRELRTSITDTGPVTCDFKVLEISHPRMLRDQITFVPH